MKPHLDVQILTNPTFGHLNCFVRNFWNQDVYFIFIIANLGHTISKIWLRPCLQCASHRIFLMAISKRKALISLLAHAHNPIRYELYDPWYFHMYALTIFIRQECNTACAYFPVWRTKNGHYLQTAIFDKDWHYCASKAGYHLQS